MRFPIQIIHRFRQIGNPDTVPVPVELLNDQRLTAEARGLYIRLAGTPAGFMLDPADAEALGPLFRELIEAGWIVEDGQVFELVTQTQTERSLHD